LRLSVKLILEKNTKLAFHFHPVGDYPGAIFIRLNANLVQYFANIGGQQQEKWATFCKYAASEDEFKKYKTRGTFPLWKTISCLMAWTLVVQ
jgi:hypothetical protein